MSWSGIKYFFSFRWIKWGRKRPSPKPTLPEPTKPQEPVQTKPVIPDTHKPTIPIPTVNTYKEAWFKLAMKITGRFEGKGYTQVTGNFDGQGISVGIFQWNYGQGSLQSRILKPAIEKYGEDWVDSFFYKMETRRDTDGNSYEVKVPLKGKVAHTAKMGTRSGINHAKKYMLRGSKLHGDWRVAWERFMGSEEMIAIQIEASRSNANKAWGYCKSYNLKSVKAFCFFFDIVVQNGSMKGKGLGKTLTNVFDYEDGLRRDGGANKSNWTNNGDGRDNEETRAIFRLTLLRVKRNRWAKDVISRKGTIAHGFGRVHGKDFDFREQFKELA